MTQISAVYLHFNMWVQPWRKDVHVLERQAGPSTPPRSLSCEDALSRFQFYLGSMGNEQRRHPVKRINSLNDIEAGNTPTEEGRSMSNLDGILVPPIEDLDLPG